MGQRSEEAGNCTTRRGQDAVVLPRARLFSSSPGNIVPFQGFRGTMLHFGWRRGPKSRVPFVHPEVRACLTTPQNLGKAMGEIPTKDGLVLAWRHIPEPPACAGN